MNEGLRKNENEMAEKIAEGKWPNCKKSPGS